MITIGEIYIMEIKQLRHFLAAAETESFSRGAERAFVSQPALSASIARLEQELDVSLFVRNRRGVALTPEGRRLAVTARSVVEECSRAKFDLKKGQRGEMVRVGISESLEAGRVARLVAEFGTAHRSVFVDVIDGRSDDILDRFERGRLDIVIFSQTERDELGELDRELYREPYVVALPSGHPLSGHETIDFTMLDGEAFVARDHCDYRKGLADALRESGARPRLAFRTSSDDRAAAFVAAGLGLTIVPNHFEIDGARKIPLRGSHIAVWCLRVRDQAPEAVGAFATYAAAANWLRG